MAETSIPVDLHNPGQVFASLGFLEAADILCGDAEGGFDWGDEADVKFRLHASGTENPFAIVLGFLAEAEIQSCGPVGYDARKAAAPMIFSETFPCLNADQMALPIVMSRSGTEIGLGHWTDGSSRKPFKLYAGNRSAEKIARDMVDGAKGGIAALWSKEQHRMVERPFDVLSAMRGSFNFDPRGGWVALDAGYSPNEHKDHQVQASPTLELLAAWGLEHARPEYDTRRVRYGAWGDILPPLLARAVLGGANTGVPARVFQFELALSGKNKIVTPAREVRTR
ncbi:MAG: type I-U CRISPR-associated protein Cas8c [Dehalococcoidia bacterium]